MSLCSAASPRTQRAAPVRSSGEQWPQPDLICYSYAITYHALNYHAIHAREIHTVGLGTARRTPESVATAAARADGRRGSANVERGLLVGAAEALQARAVERVGLARHVGALAERVAARVAQLLEARRRLGEVALVE